MNLMDYYNILHYRGQKQQIKALRYKLGMTQKELAKRYHVTIQIIKRWKGDKVQISKSTWKMLFL